MMTFLTIVLNIIRKSYPVCVHPIFSPHCSLHAYSSCTKTCIMSLRTLTYSYSILYKPFALSSVRGLASKAADVPPLPPFNAETAYKLVVSTYPCPPFCTSQSD